jgi:hypothetical protein
MERIVGEDSSWWECAICGIDPSRDESLSIDEDEGAEDEVDE